ncbi:MAG: HAD hydrolase family protein [Planctomycetota bacterium]|nr:HAD hydrolase family protein [Planctomycetota bacterium]
MMDVDGVLTTGEIFVDAQGNESKVFHVHDGSGIIYLHRQGIRTALITGRRSKAVELRAKELGIEDVYQGAKDKIRPYEEIRSKRGLTDEEVCYVGDDLLDLPCLRKAGFPVAVSNATEEVKSVARYVTARSGGQGAIREVAELILKAQGKWKSIVDRAGL